MAWCVLLVGIAAMLAIAVNARALSINDRLLLTVAQGPGGTILTALMFSVSLLGLSEVTAVVMLGLTFQARRSPGWWLPLLVFVGINVIEFAVKDVVHQPAPPFALHRGPTFGIDVATSGSFPSGHMARGAFVYGILALRLWSGTRRYRWLWACIAFTWLLAFSRVYLAEHWPTDVAGGILLGGAGLALALAIAPRAVFAAPPDG